MEAECNALKGTFTLVDHLTSQSLKSTIDLADLTLIRSSYSFVSLFQVFYFLLFYFYFVFYFILFFIIFLFYLLKILFIKNFIFKNLLIYRNIILMVLIL